MLNNEAPKFNKCDRFERGDEVYRINLIEYLQKEKQYYYSGIVERWSVNNGFSFLRTWSLSESQLDQPIVYRGPLTSEEIEYLEGVELKLNDHELGIKQVNEV